MRLLITGHTGFIGRNLLRGLSGERCADEILCVARHPGNASGRQCDEVLWDLSEEAGAEAVRRIGAFRPDAVVHCAGKVPDCRQETGDQLVDVIRHNIIATTRLIDVVSSINRGVRFVHIGTAAEYGQVVDRPDAVSEEDLPKPHSFYGITKLAATQLVLSYGRSGLIRPTVLRVFNPVGPHAPESTLIGRAASLINNADIIKSGRVTFGSLSDFRDFVSIKEVARAIIMTLRDDEKSVGEILNIGSGAAMCARDLVRALMEFAQCKCEVVESYGEAMSRAKASWSMADIRKAAKVIGWQPEYTLVETLRDIVGAHVDKQ